MFQVLASGTSTNFDARIPTGWSIDTMNSTEIVQHSPGQRTSGFFVWGSPMILEGRDYSGSLKIDQRSVVWVNFRGWWEYPFWVGKSLSINQYFMEFSLFFPFASPRPRESQYHCAAGCAILCRAPQSLGDERGGGAPHRWGQKNQQEKKNEKKRQGQIKKSQRLAGWNVQGALQRQKEEGSGRLGTAAWHLTVTAAANLVFEIGAGDVAVEAGAPQLRIESRHITRAHKRVSLSHSLVSIWTGKGPMMSKVSCFHDSSLHSTHWFFTLFHFYPPMFQRS